jgi:glycosyltransferase involved in cell wall biosynthesis
MGRGISVTAIRPCAACGAATKAIDTPPLPLCDSHFRPYGTIFAGGTIRPPSTSISSLQIRKMSRARIQRFYGRESVVIHPPVDTQRFIVDSRTPQRDGFFLTVSQLVHHKRIDLIVNAFTVGKLPLLIIGDGPERQKLERRAGKNIRFAGSLPQRHVIEAMQHCKAFVFAGEEDFGIVMAEAQACGTPVVAFAKGGALEIIEDNLTGVLFDESSVDSLLQALDRFDHASFDPELIRASAMRFTRQRFLDEFTGLLRQCVFHEAPDGAIPHAAPGWISCGGSISLATEGPSPVAQPNVPSSQS